MHGIAIITMPKGFASLLWQYRTAAKLKSIKVIITSGVPISSADRLGNYDVKYDENAVKTVPKCLARMKACWGPEFEPSVEEIVDYR